MRRIGKTLLAVCVLGAGAVWGMAAAGDDVGDFARNLFGGAAKNFIRPSDRSKQPSMPQQAPQPQPQASRSGPRGQQFRAAVKSQPYVARTGDGWRIVAKRFWLDGRVVPGRLPVILCHGFSYNGQFFDLRPDLSLANYLAERGFDVWVVDLRGSGMSSKWALTTAGGADALLGRFASDAFKQIPPNGYVSLDPKYANWTLDDHVSQDIPAILQLVKSQTNSAQVAWLGHSMGGNVMLAYLSKNGQDASVGRLITVGSQVTMPKGQILGQFLIEYLKQRKLELIGQQPSVTEVYNNAQNLFFNEANADAGVVNALATYGHDMPSTGILAQYMDLGNTGRLQDARRRLDYSAGISKIQCPYLIVAGAIDQIAPPSVQAHLYQSVTSADKTLLIMGRRTGFSIDYGHNDSLVSPAASREVFPLIARWLEGQKLAAEPPVRRPR